MSSEQDKRRQESNLPLPYQLLEQIMASGNPCWQYEEKGVYRNRFTNPERIPQIITDAASRIHFPSDTLPHFDPEVDTKEMIGKMNSFFSFIEKQGIVTKDMLVLLNTLSSPSNITFDTAEFRGDVSILDSVKGIFPTTPEEGPKINFNPEIFVHQTNYYLELAKIAGIEIDSQKLFRAVAASGFVHERAHLLEFAFLNKLHEFVANDPRYENSWDTIVASMDLFVDKAKEKVENIIPGSDPLIEKMTYSERLATGFELLSLDFFLQQEGISDGMRIRMMDEVYKQRAKGLNMKRELIKKLYSKGFSDGEISYFTQDVEAFCRDIVGESWPLVALAGGTYFWSELGNYSPYTQEELRYILEGAFSELTEQNARRLIIDHSSEQ